MKATPNDDLTPKQRLFVNEYLVDLNATAAYKRAGYVGKGNVAEVTASQLLRNPKIARQVKLAMDKRADDIGVDSKYVLRMITTTIERCAQARQVFDKKGEPVFVETPDGGIAPAYVFDAANVLKGSDMLAKHVGLYEKDNEQQKPDAPETDDLDWARRIAFALRLGEKSKSTIAQNKKS